MQKLSKVDYDWKCSEKLEYILAVTWYRLKNYLIQTTFHLKRTGSFQCLGFSGFEVWRDNPFQFEHFVKDLKCIKPELLKLAQNMHKKFQKFISQV